MEKLKQKLKTFVEDHKTGVMVAITIVGGVIVGKNIYYAGARYGSVVTALALNEKLPEANVLGEYTKIIKSK